MIHSYVCFFIIRLSKLIWLRQREIKQERVHARATHIINERYE